MFAPSLVWTLDGPFIKLWGPGVGGLVRHCPILCTQARAPPGTLEAPGTGGPGGPEWQKGLHVLSSLLASDLEQTTHL